MQVFKQAYTHILVLQDSNHYLLSTAREWSSKRCNPTFRSHKLACFNAWRLKDEIILISLEKLTQKGCIQATRVKLSLRNTINVNETNNVY